MSAAVDDIGHGDGHESGMKAAQVLEEMNAEEIRRGPGRGHGDAQDRVRSQLRFVFRAVEFNHGPVDVDLVQRIQPLDLRRDHVVHVLNGFQYALSDKAASCRCR